MKGLEIKERGNRLAQLLNELGENPNSFSKKIGAPQSTIHRAITIGVGVSPKLGEKISKRFSRVSVGWLMTGEGSMFFEGKNEADPRVQEVGELGNGLIKVSVDVSGLLEKLTELEAANTRLANEMAELRARLDGESK